jgi:hypothetical protein
MALRLTRFTILLKDIGTWTVEPGITRVSVSSLTHFFVYTTLIFSHFSEFFQKNIHIFPKTDIHSGDYGVGPEAASIPAFRRTLPQSG